MLRLRSHLLSAVRAAASPLPAAAASLHRLLLYSTTTSPTRFVAEEFLVTTCGLTPAQALRASRHLAHLKSPSKPEAVLAFFENVGLAKADVASAIAREPSILCSKVDETLTPRLALLRGIGLTPSQISRLITIAPNVFRSHGMISRLSFYLSFLGSYEKVHTALSRNVFLLGQSLERVVKPNMVFLRQCGLTDCDIAKLFLLVPMLLMLELERVKEILACADKLGVPRNSAMFKHALMVVYSLNPGRIDAKLHFLKKELGCSEDELAIAVRKLPNVLNFTEGKLSRLVYYLKMEIGLEADYIVHRPALLRYSMKRRLMPRHHFLKILKEKGLVKKDIDFYNVVCLTEKRFVKKFIDPYKEGVPGLVDAYAAACAEAEQVLSESMIA